LWDGYADYAGVELINTARVAAYSAAHGITIECDDCPELADAVGDDPYDWFAGVQDSAPWVDPTRPESREFLGVLGLGVTGTEDAQVSRQPTDLIGDGVALGPLRRKGREIAFTVGLVCLTEHALSYAIGWLASVLRGGACGASACQGDALCMFAACPQSPGGSDELRHLYDVGLLEGPKIDSRTYLPGGSLMAQATFTLVAATPQIFSEPLPGVVDWLPLAKGAVLYGVDPDLVYAQCKSAKPCVQDPKCPQPRTPPRPPMPRSPCLPKGKANFRQTLFRLDPRSAPDWFEMVPVVEVEPGKQDMRRLIIRFWNNPSGSDCGKLSDPCQACFDISVPYLPKGSVLMVDGRTQRALVQCPQEDTGLVASASPELYGPAGRAFEWPVFSCPTGVCVEVLTQREATASDARVRVSLVARGDAA
jgi:hypothetical protein